MSTDLDKLRIPVVSSPFPGHPYIVVVMICGEDDLWGPALKPTDAEAAQIASFTDFQREYYGSGKPQEGPFDLWNRSSIVLCNLGEGTELRKGSGWKYNRPHWRSGPLWAPYEISGLTLEDLLSHYETNGGVTTASDWTAWKANHPEAFPV
jgi:hypothetical protein